MALLQNGKLIKLNIMKLDNNLIQINSNDTVAVALEDIKEKDLIKV